MISIIQHKLVTITTATSTSTSTSAAPKTAGFDGTRILPHPECRPLSCDVQNCIQWRQGDQSKCQTEIDKLRTCMESTRGTVAKPTEGDKVWSV
mmetsp:Transcript_3315/g.7196  ORF Transcript_3315/g.7196 Transcript_3315/m.7196 type:complete len:94 (+) Transcript_3315:181-462(+)